MWDEDFSVTTMWDGTQFDRLGSEFVDEESTRLLYHSRGVMIADTDDGDLAGLRAIPPTLRVHLYRMLLPIRATFWSVDWLRWNAAIEPMLAVMSRDVVTVVLSYLVRRDDQQCTIWANCDLRGCGSVCVTKRHSGFKWDIVPV